MTKRKHVATLTVDDEKWLAKQKLLSYNCFTDNHVYRFCWACGRDGGFSPATGRPSDWFAPWLIERAHIIGGNRVKDPRAIILLCSLCHRASHCAHFTRIIVDGEPFKLPRLYLPHRLWLKRVFDPENYDRKFIQGLGVGLLPNIHKPPRGYLEQLKQRRGGVVAECLQMT